MDRRKHQRAKERERKVIAWDAHVEAMRQAGYSDRRVATGPRRVDRPWADSITRNGVNIPGLDNREDDDPRGTHVPDGRVK